MHAFVVFQYYTTTYHISFLVFLHVACGSCSIQEFLKGKRHSRYSTRTQVGFGIPFVSHTQGSSRGVSMCQVFISFVSILCATWDFRAELWFFAIIVRFCCLLWPFCAFLLKMSEGTFSPCPWSACWPPCFRPGFAPSTWIAARQG